MPFSKHGLFTVPEVCRYLRLSRATVYALIADGTIPSVKIGRSRRVPKREVMKLATAKVPT